MLVAQEKSRVYDFPVKPGTPEWERLQTYKEKLNAYNIPDKLLAVMNTGDLVQTCLNYPEFRLIMTRNSLQQGYDYLKTIFNGFSELEKRSDAGAELIKEYKKFNPAEIRSYDTPVKRGEFAFKITYVEILLAQKPMLSGLDKTSKKELIKTVVFNYEIIKKMPENYATFGLLTPTLMLGRLLDISNQEDFKNIKLKSNKLRYFIVNSELLDEATLTDILACSKKYLNQLSYE